MSEDRILNCLVLNDYPEAPYATWVAQQVKTIETRMVSFKYRGDLVICCGNKSVTSNRGKALCIVNLFAVRDMFDNEEDVEAACIEYFPGRKAHLLKDWRYFSRTFEYKYYRVSGSFQSIFQIRMPDDVQILASPATPKGD